MKYMGSKTRIAKHILPIILKDRTENQFYVEPFVGGANLIDKVEGKRIGADSNEFLIALLCQIRDDVTELPKNHKEAPREMYYNVKKGMYSKWIKGFYGFLCSYSGKWFGGYAGLTKTKGGERDYIEEAYKNVEKQSADLQGVEFYNCNYDELEIPAMSIIYCDPPYANTTGYKDSFYHERFFEWCREMSRDGHTVFVSEYNAPDDFECVWEREVKSSLSANGKSGSSKKSTEKLFKI